MRRWWILTAAATAFALAAGIAFGVGFSKGEPESVDEPIGPVTAIEAFDTEVLGSLTQPVVAGKLVGQSVAIVSSPNVTDLMLTDVTQSITQAGGEVSASVALTEEMLSSNQRQFVESVAQQSNPGMNAEPGVSSYALAARALGEALVNDSAKGETVLRAFAEGNLVTVAQAPTKPATLVLFIGGTTRPDAGEAQIVNELAVELATMCKGAAISGTSLHSLPRGYIYPVTPGTVSTFDVLDSPTGRSLVSLVLAAEAGDQSGSWGTSRAANGPVPKI